MWELKLRKSGQSQPHPEDPERHTDKGPRSHQDVVIRVQKYTGVSR